MEELEPLRSGGGNIKKCSHGRKQQKFITSLQIESLHDLAMSLLGICPPKLKRRPQRDICTATFKAAFTIAKMCKLPRCAWWMSGHTKCGPSTHWSVTHQEGRNTDTCYSTNETGGREWNKQSQKDKNCRILSYEVRRVVRFIEQKVG